MKPLRFVFVHGYSVTTLDTYGGLPERLVAECQAHGRESSVDSIALGRYISLNDAVQLDDISRALENAIRELLQKDGSSELIFITHSTGGPVVRNWIRLFYPTGDACPASHVIMLAPANHGSTLAQLGKSRLSRVISWLDGLEPGQGVLDWLELGSYPSWLLNSAWAKGLLPVKPYLFVITGQDIDRKLYDHINSYTGEAGSDGVVRTSSANLNNRYLLLVDGQPHQVTAAPATPFLVVKGVSHSGPDMGIMRSVSPAAGGKGQEVVEAIFACVGVNDDASHARLLIDFERQTLANKADLLVEPVDGTLPHKPFVHRRHSMVIFQVNDQDGKPVEDFDLLITGPGHSPDTLPTGFFVDRQANRKHPGSLTYYFNYDMMVGCEPIIDSDGQQISPGSPGIKELGVIVKARPDRGFIRFASFSVSSNPALFQQVIRPDSTTLVEIRLHREISEEVFRFEAIARKDLDFGHTLPGDTPIPDLPGRV